MNAINAAIYAKLNVSSLTSLLATTNTPSSIFHLQAVDGAAYPFVVFNKMSDAEPNDTAHRVIDTIYQVRGFTRTSAAAADAIALAVDALLHRVTLSITGYAVLRVYRTGGLEFIENQQSTDKVYSAGSLFRITVEKT